MRREIVKKLDIILIIASLIFLSGIDAARADKTAAASAGETAAPAGTEPANTDAPIADGAADKEEAIAPAPAAVEIPPVDEVLDIDEPMDIEPANLIPIVTSDFSETISGTETLSGSEEPDSGDPAAVLGIVETAGTSQASSVPETAAAADQNQAGAAPESSQPIPVANVTTGIIRGLDIGSLTIIALWQMTVGETGADDSSAANAQILPSGQYGVDKKLSVCALIADPAGAEAVTGAAAGIAYPAGIAGAGKTGCGQTKSEVILTKLERGQGEALFCDRIRNANNSLPSWTKSADNILFGYSQACGAEGYLARGAAAVFCAETALSYDDPAGDYKVAVTTGNAAGIMAAANSSFRYLELTTFENDFTDIQYGPVAAGEWKTVAGDAAFGYGGLPTVRNTGNTRLRMKVSQNDFGLGKAGADWNISYRARTGDPAVFTDYAPFETVVINNPINLGAAINIDFAVLIKAFPDNGSDFAGTMVLTADIAPPLACKI